jgi:hypothetical protein
MKIIITIYYIIMMTMLQKRLYQKKKQAVEKFIKRFGKVEHSFILNEVDIDYDTLMKILAELRNEGRIK